MRQSGCVATKVQKKTWGLWPSCKCSVPSRSYYGCLIWLESTATLCFTILFSFFFFFSFHAKETKTLGNFANSLIISVKRDEKEPLPAYWNQIKSSDKTHTFLYWQRFSAFWVVISGVASCGSSIGRLIEDACAASREPWAHSLWASSISCGFLKKAWCQQEAADLFGGE